MNATFCKYLLFYLYLLFLEYRDVMLQKQGVYLKRYIGVSFYAIIQCLTLCMQTRKCGEKTGAAPLLMVSNMIQTHLYPFRYTGVSKRILPSFTSFIFYNYNQSVINILKDGTYLAITCCNHLFFIMWIKRRRKQ